MSWSERRQREREQTAQLQARREASVLRRVQAARRHGVALEELHDRLVLASALTAGATPDVTRRALVNLADRGEVHVRDGLWWPGPGPTPPQGSRVEPPGSGGDPAPGATAGPTSEPSERTPPSGSQAAPEEVGREGVRPTSPDQAYAAVLASPGIGLSRLAVQIGADITVLGRALRADPRFAVVKAAAYRSAPVSVFAVTPVPTPPPSPKSPPGEAATARGCDLSTSPPSSEPSPQASQLEASGDVPWARAGGPDECPHGYAAGVPCRRCCGELVDDTPLRPAAPAEDTTEWHDGALWVHQREQIDHPVPAGWWVCHESFETAASSGSRRVAVAQHRGEAHARGRANALRWPYPTEVPEEALGYPSAPKYVEPDALTQAADEIARLCGCPTWDYPGQLVRDVRALVDERDALRLERDSLRAQHEAWSHAVCRKVDAARRRIREPLEAALGGGEVVRALTLPALADEVERVVVKLREDRPPQYFVAVDHGHDHVRDLLTEDVRALVDERDALRLERDSLRAQHEAWRRHNDAIATFLGAKAGQDDEVLRIAAALHREAQGEVGDDASEVLTFVIRDREDACADRDAALADLATVLGESVSVPIEAREVDAARRRIREPLEAALGGGEVVRALTLPALADEVERVVVKLREDRPPQYFVAVDHGHDHVRDLLTELRARASASGLRVPQRGGDAALVAYLTGWLEAHGVITAPSPEAT